MSAQFQDDRVRFDAIRKNLAALAKQVTTVGVHSDAAPRDDLNGLTEAGLAAVHEFGISDGDHHIPERSFLRAGIDHNKSMLSQDMQDCIGKVVDLTLQPEDAAERVGILGVDAVRREIEGGIAPELAPMTKAQRDRKAAHGGGLAAMQGKYTPLHDTGHLLNSITYKTGTSDAESR